MMLKRSYKVIAVFMAINLITTTVFPTISWALTSGPTQPEVSSFEPVGTTDMVNLFSGDFTYNIPLFELPGPNGGYPFNLSYHSGIGMDQEASWVGLGWSLNPGAITRQMRGLPDEFSGSTDKVGIKKDMRPNQTWGVGVGVGVEFVGSDKALGVAVNAGLSVFQNNYKGIGYSIEAGISFNHKSTSNDRTVGAGLNLTLSSQDGFSVRPSLSLESDKNDVEKSYQLSIGYNSQRGLTDLSFSHNLKTTEKTKKPKKGVDRTRTIGGSYSLSFANTAYSPKVDVPMVGKNLSGTFKVGAELFFVHPNSNIRGFYSNQKLKNANEWQYTEAYGYLYLDKKGEKTNVLQDFNREKDGVVYKTSPNLAIPSMTYDIYTIQGQGIGGMFRPYRNDIGIIHDQSMESKISGGSFGIDLGFGNASHLGANLKLTQQKTNTDLWKSNNDAFDVCQYQSVDINNATYEPYYFKVHGEMSIDDPSELDYIGGEEAVRFDISKGATTTNLHNSLIGERKNRLGALTTSFNPTEDREERNQVVQQITNEMLEDTRLPEYNIKHFEIDDATASVSTNAVDLDRRYDKTNHLSGYTITKPDGMRYVYALPVYNKEQREYLFSVDCGSMACHETVGGKRVSKKLVNAEVNNYKDGDTDQTYSETDMPEYAHSYMLTSIIGPDYIDADSEPGPSKGDFGYWCKFTYAKSTKDYKWRAPFTGANFMEGDPTAYFDDKASFVYGERESFYLTRAETKSHIAIFELGKRDDARGAKDASTYNKAVASTGNNTITDAHSFRLDKISLYARAAYEANSSQALPIKEILFTYDHTLCNGVTNNANGTGKLTLKRLEFNYQKSKRGSLTPYVFSYGNNKDYHTHHTDRWGNYKSNYNFYYPYVDQYTSPDDIHEDARAWTLNQVKLPSGGTINLEYESDDYAYVQNKVACQMAPIVGISGIDNAVLSNDGQGRTLYFKGQGGESSDYFNGINQLYFKMKLKMRSASEGPEHLITGYADIEDHGKVDDETYWVKVKEIKKYNPISYAGWQFLKMGRPDLINTFGEVNRTKLNTSQASMVNAVKGLVSLIPQIQRVFKGFHGYCDSKGWCKKVDLDNAWIRVTNPSMKKYGGGLRVKKLTISDAWDEMTKGEKASQYGQVYDYTTTEDDKTISSGVAVYEPMIGGDENPLRYAKHFKEKIPLKSNRQLSFEYPINESYYPGASVGYRKVTVKSLATHLNEQWHQDQAPAYAPYKDIFTTGKSVHEFYTAKEFPVITTETDIDITRPKLFVPIPFIGLVSIMGLGATQGYAIQLNDMHGKPRKESYFSQTKDGSYQFLPYRYTEYLYKKEDVVVNGNSASKLNNNVRVLMSIGSDDGTLSAAKATIRDKILGQDYEFFTDMRQNTNETITGGVSANVDFTIIPPVIVAAAPTVWPDFGISITETKTVVTNKIIHKAGIMSGMINFNDGASVKQEYILFDKIGRPIMTKTTNLF